MRRQRTLQEQEYQTAAAWCAGCAVCYLLFSLLGSFVGAAQLTHWMQGAGANSSLAKVELYTWCINLLFSFVGLLVPIFAGAWFYRMPPQQMYLQLPEKNKILPALAVYLGGSQLFGIVAGLVGNATGSQQEIPVPDTLLAQVLCFFTICLVPAVCEELLFRGVMQGILRPCGLWLAIVGQAIPFALLHGSASAIAFALPAGLFFGWLAERSKSILPGMVLHFINNTLAFVQMLLLKNGAETMGAAIAGVELIVFPLLGLGVAIWWFRQGGLAQRLERVSRVDRLLYSAPWVLTQVFLLAFSLMFA